MITAVFSVADENIIGFDIMGHSGYAQAGQDIVCAAVSSAAYLTANLLEKTGTEIESSVQEGKMSVRVKNPDSQTALILAQLKEHLIELKHQYPQNIQTAEIKLKAGGKK